MTKNGMKLDVNLFLPQGKKELRMMKTLKRYEANLELKESSLCKKLKHLSFTKPCFDGVFTKEEIPAYQPVCRYYGDVFHLYKDVNPKTGKRVNMYDVEFTDRETVLDGSAFVPEFYKSYHEKKETWNFGPFLNDYYPENQKNNCKINGAFWDSKRKKFFKVIMSTKKIKKGEELCWSYGAVYWKQFKNNEIVGFLDQIPNKIHN